uniref:Uncharacterized protein n=1 Tax=Schistocephalus solidus TaxID=70667 RepID=A0A0X3Q0D0_SCHSO
MCKFMFIVSLPRIESIIPDFLPGICRPYVFACRLACFVLLSGQLAASERLLMLCFFCPPAQFADQRFFFLWMQASPSFCWPQRWLSSSAFSPVDKDSVSVIVPAAYAVPPNVACNAIAVGANCIPPGRTPLSS